MRMPSLARSASFSTGRVEPGALAAEILDQLREGVLVIDRASGAIVYDNRVAQRALLSFGAPPGVVPSALIKAIRRSASLARSVIDYVGAESITAPNGRRYFVRASAIADADATVVFVIPAVLRDRDLAEILRTRFALSHRQVSMVQGVRAGLTNRELADAIGLAPATVKKYLTAVYETLGVRGRVELLVFIRRLVPTSTS